jgi:hypothetical protein
MVLGRGFASKGLNHFHLLLYLIFNSVSKDCQVFTLVTHRCQQPEACLLQSPHPTRIKRHGPPNFRAQYYPCHHTDIVFPLLQSHLRFMLGIPSILHNTTMKGGPSALVMWSPEKTPNRDKLLFRVRAGSYQGFM